MAKPYRLKEVEASAGIGLNDLIPALLNELGSQKLVAERLGVSQTTISTWLKASGYVPVVTWRKGNENEEPNQAA